MYFLSFLSVLLVSFLSFYVYQRFFHKERSVIDFLIAHEDSEDKPALTSNEVVALLSEEFLGKEFKSSLKLPQEQANFVIAYEIILKYQILNLERKYRNGNIKRTCDGCPSEV